MNRPSTPESTLESCFMLAWELQATPDERRELQRDIAETNECNALVRKVQSNEATPEEAARLNKLYDEIWTRETPRKEHLVPSALQRAVRRFTLSIEYDNSGPDGGIIASMGRMNRRHGGADFASSPEGCPTIVAAIAGLHVVLLEHVAVQADALSRIVGRR